MIDGYFRRQYYMGSECTFTNLFMWRKGFQLEWAEEKEALIIKAGRNNVGFILQPFGIDDSKLPAVMEQIDNWFDQQGISFGMHGTAPFVKALDTLLPGRYQWEPDRDNFDYVYLANDLIELAGRKFSSKKNHINYFLTHYPDHEYVPMTPDNICECLAAEEEWYQNRADDDPGLVQEKYAIREALTNFEYLGLKGGIIKIYGKVEAFTFGEQLNKDTAIIHVEKGNAEYRGLYQMINREFVRNAWSDMTYINREEDMGIVGLRRAKKSYQPVMMVEKFKISRA